MTQPVTEIAYITLKPGLTVEGDTPAAQVWKDTLETVSAQEGFQKYYYGTQLEREDVLMFLIDWTAIADHQKFIASPTYAPFVGHLSTITTSINLHHTQSIPFPPSILAEAPCIELATFYGCTPSFFEKNLKVFANALHEGGLDGYHAYVVGEVVESVAKGGVEAEEGKGRAVTLWIGWDTKEAHMKARESQLFVDNIGLLRKDCEAAEMFHVHFKTS